MVLVAQVHQFLTQHKLDQHLIILGLSGGIDSVVLLDVLAKSSITNTNILAVHVDHGLNEEASEWALFCQTLCQSYGISCHIEKVTLTHNHLGVEGAARQARYQAFSKYVVNGSVLLTAQHQNDQCETLLLALKRGSGVLGLAGMPYITSFFNAKHARPLLDVTQLQINEYAIENNLKWVEDNSNKNTRFDRNFLRNEVIETLNLRWPSFSANAARTATLCQEQMDLADEIAALDFSKGDRPNHMLSISLLNSLSEARLNNLLRYWLRLNRVLMPSQKQLIQIKSQCLDARRDSLPLIELGHYQVRCYAQYLFVVNPKQLMLEKVSLKCDFSTPLQLPNYLGTILFNSEQPMFLVKAPDDTQRVTIEFGLAGSLKAWPSTRAKRRTLKKLWQEYDIPPWERGSIPYLCFDGVLVAAIGYWVEKDFLVDEQYLKNSRATYLNIEHQQLVV